MKPRTVCLGLCLAGIVLPYWQLLPFLRDHGLDLRLFLTMRESALERRA